jgi:hypothetical protein
MPTAYRELLRLAHPGLKLMTPATAFRTLGGRSSAVANPFDGLQIGFSISDSPDTNGPCGFVKEHVDDVAVHLSRSLISTGAHLAYGGDFRQGGYTFVFSELISAYRQTAGASDDILHSYIAAHLPLVDVPDDLQLELRHLDLPPLSSEAALPSPKIDPTVPGALYFSDMRRVMTGHIFARLLLGGAALPRVDEIGQKGYGGLYPGVIEEAWWSLRAGQPMYVMGGFGGAAGIVAALMSGKDAPDVMEEASWRQHPSFAARANEITTNSSFALLDVPTSMDSMAMDIRRLTANLLRTNDTALAWNGLTVAENLDLLQTRDALRITALVHRGLGHCMKRLREGKLAIELVQGSVTSAQGLDAIAVGVFEGMPLGGAGAALDQLVSGRASVAHAAGQALVGIDTPGVAAAFLYLASLGKFDDLGNLSERVRFAAESTAACALRHQFSRLGIVSYGGAMLGESLPIFDAMISGLEVLIGQAEIVWFESDPERFAALRSLLDNDPRISLTTRRLSNPAPAIVSAKMEQLIISVALESDQLTVTVMPPSGTGVAGTRRIPFTRKQMISYSRGAAGRNTPPSKELAIRGQEIAKLLLGDDACHLLKRCRHARITMLHDVASSQLPFEALFTPSDVGEIRPAVDSGINRRLAVSGLATHQLFARPPHAGRLRVLVVINPLGDLAGAEEEGISVCAALRRMDNVEVIELAGKAATKPAFLNAIAEADVLHYCGHAFFDGPGSEESGLNLWGDPLFFSDLSAAPSDLRVVFANACEAGRVRAPEGADEAASFAEFLLRTGLEAFLGTYWRVADSAAHTFSTEVYASLTQGETFDTAVKTGRNHLLQTGSAEWANYVLYGEGQFRIVTG